MAPAKKKATKTKSPSTKPAADEAVDVSAQARLRQDAGTVGRCMRPRRRPTFPAS